ncbi:MAG TPA: response regulator, partial [Chloroflexota bacterium]
KEVLSTSLASIRGFVDRKERNLLVVEDDDRQRKSIVDLIGNGDIRVTAVGTGEEALATLKSGDVDCVVMDIGLPDMSGFDLIDKIRKDRTMHKPPIVVYTGRDLTQSEAARLQKVADKVIVKDVRSPERLVDETALFLHRVASNLPRSKRHMVEQLHRTDAVLAGKRVLIVDDDIRNVFALTSLLEHHGMSVLTADNGAEALKILGATPDVDLVLMDIMMPEMDGYDTTRAIRKMPRFGTVPIVALTAKAEKGDRKDCLDAGVSDYLAKPVDGEQLLSALREWLHR